MDIRLANEFLDLFQQLFYSTEIWGYLGIIGVIAFAMVISAKVRFSFPFFVVVLMFMGMDYIKLVGATGYYLWHFILCVIACCFLMVLGGSQIDEGRKSRRNKG